MKLVNLGDPFVKRITLRLTDLQYKHLLNMSLQLGTSPSDYIRFLIIKSAIDYDKDMMLLFNDENMGLNQEGTSNENVKTCNNDSI